MVCDGILVVTGARACVWRGACYGGREAPPCMLCHALHARAPATHSTLLSLVCKQACKCSPSPSPRCSGIRGDCGAGFLHHHPLLFLLYSSFTNRILFLLPRAAVVYGVIAGWGPTSPSTPLSPPLMFHKPYPLLPPPRCSGVRGDCGAGVLHHHPCPLLPLGLGQAAVRLVRWRALG